MAKLASFDCVLADSVSAIRVSNEGLVRIAFDVDESQLPEAIKVLLGKDRLLRVTVEAE
jgi:hypothetical protein